MVVEFALTLSTDPHSPQNLLSPEFAAPHEGHAIASAAPHSLQNLRVVSFSVPHAEQVISTSRREGYSDPSRGVCPARR